MTTTASPAHHETHRPAVATWIVASFAGLVLVFVVHLVLRSS